MKLSQKFPRFSVYATSFVFGATLLSGCATTQNPNGRPVATGPVQGPVTGGPKAPTPKPDPKTPAPKTPKPTDTPKPQPTAPVPPQVVTRDGLTPPHMAGRNFKRVALLLPFSAKSPRLREEAGAMLKAAEMAVFDREKADVLMIALDTAGTAKGAKAATKAAIDSGVDVVLGPLLAGSVKASGGAARRSKTPIIAFSTDQSVAGNGVYLLSFPPEAEVDRIIDYAAAQGARNFAILGPDSAYGRRVNAAYQRAAQVRGLTVTAGESYKGDDISVMQAPARKLVDGYMAHLQAMDAPLFDAIMMPEGGTALRSLAPLLTYYSSDMANVIKLGTGRWNREGTALEPALRGGIFAGPDKEARAQFEADYKITYGFDATRLSSLAYDAVNIGALIATGDPRLRTTRAIDPMGFYGVDGFVRFRPDGTPHRGLAVYEVKPGRMDVIAPAPKEASELGF
ncbi:MAG: penicillin-binding protein activator [Robiginitomaculum sp.]